MQIYTFIHTIILLPRVDIISQAEESAAPVPLVYVIWSRPLVPAPSRPDQARLLHQVLPPVPAKFRFLMPHRVAAEPQVLLLLPSNGWQLKLPRGRKALAPVDPPLGVLVTKEVERRGPLQSLVTSRGPAGPHRRLGR